jgi:RNA-directed DNA polymerase
VRLSPRAVERFKEQIRSRTSRVRRISSRQLLAELDVYMRGWAGYYARFDGCGKQLGELDRWVRLRIRQWLWVSWKTPHRRWLNLRRGGVSAPTSRLAVGTRSAWRAAKGSAMGICVTNRRIEHAGLRPLLAHWQRFAAL